MYWQRDSRCAAGGWWECADKRKSRERGRYAADPETYKAKTRAYYQDRGWLLKRRRELRAQRERITQQLDLLAEEAAAC